MPPREQYRVSKRSTGTSNALKSDSPFMPLFKRNSDSASPERERSGFTDGKRESSPANIPAAGMSAVREIKTRKSGAARPNSRRVAPSYPPYFFPRERKKFKNRKNANDETASGKRNASAGKKRTSSAPERNPAPTVAPTKNNVVCNVCTFILPIYAEIARNMRFF